MYDGLLFTMKKSAPKGWKSGRLIEFFELKRGFDITKREVSDGPFPVYSSSGLSYFHNKKISDGPGVVTGRKGSVGQVFFIEEPYWPHDTTLWVSDFKESLPEFVWRFLEAARLEKFDEASSVPTLNRNNIHHRYCCFPPFIEQRKLAEILRTWDEGIDRLDALRSAKSQHQKALSRQFFDPCHPSFHGRSNSWREFELGDVFRERVESDSNGEALLSITMSGGVINREDVGRKDTSNEDKSRYKLILPGDIGYNTMRMWQGVSGLSTLRGIVSPAYTIVTPDNHHIAARYAAHLFKSQRMVFDFQRYSQGLTSDTWNLKFPAFSEIRVFLPPLEDQEQQADLLDAMNEEVALLERQRKALERQKRGLMQKLLTGEWRVRFEAQKEAVG